MTRIYDSKYDRDFNPVTDLGLAAALALTIHEQTGKDMDVAAFNAVQSLSIIAGYTIAVDYDAAIQVCDAAEELLVAKQRAAIADRQQPLES